MEEELREGALGEGDEQEQQQQQQEQQEQRAGRAAFARARLILEMELLRQQLWALVVCAVVLIYGAMMVFRNVAFYRYRIEQGRLQDAGFELLPDWENKPHQWVGDVPMYVISAAMAAMFLAAFVAPASGCVGAKPFVLNMLLRYSQVLAVGHTLRFVTYVSTIYPGSSEQCLGELHHQPTTLVEVFFTRFALVPGENCGDLMFSGHMLQMITPVLCVSRYGQAAFSYSRSAHMALLALLWLCVALLCVSIVMRRHHYTQDVVTGAYVTPLLWHFYSGAVRPRDVQPLSLSQRGVCALVP